MCAPQPSPFGYWIVSPAQAQHLRGEALIGGFQIVRRWLTRSRQMRALADLDDRLLDDVGLTRSDAEREMARAIRHSFARRHQK